MNQFLMVDMALLKDRKTGKNKVNNNEILALALLNQRMNLSLTKGALFYDSNAHEHYTIYQLKDMAFMLDLSERTVSDIYNHLEELGLIRRVKQFNMPDKIFIPSFTANRMKPKQEEPRHENDSNVDAKIAGTYMQNSQPSYIYNTYINKHTDTVDTEKLEKENEIKKLRTAIIGKSCMNPNAVDAVIKYANNDADKVEQLIGIIYCAKKAVAQSSGLLHAKITRFENNDHMNNNLFSRLNHIFSYADNAQKPSGYIYNALVSYFIKEFGLSRDEKVSLDDNTSQGHQATNNAPKFDAFSEDAKDIHQPKLVDSLALTESLRRYNLSDYPSDQTQQAIKDRIEALLTEHGIDPSATTIPTDKDGLLDVINADIANV